MRLLQNFNLSLFLVLLLGPAAEGAGHKDLVTIYIPAFNGPRELGMNVATILNLQIWRTLRKAANHDSFGRGLIVWDTTPLDPPSFESADELANLGLDDDDGARVYPQLVFWGNTKEFGDGFVAESFLSIAPSYSGDSRDMWVVTFSQDGIDFRIHADLPQRRYEFSTITLKKELVHTYSKPTALKIYQSRNTEVPIGSVGAKYDALQQEDGWVKLKSEGITGWVPLPKLSETKYELVDFVGGIIRVLRSDWDGATKLFENVVKNTHTPTALKVDALLYLTLVKSKAGKDTEENLQMARDLAPFYRATTIYTVMAKLEALRKVTSGPRLNMAKATIVRQIETELNRNEQLFLPDDPWMLSVLQLLNILR